MANLHDISWGNRVTDNKKGEDTRKNLEQFRATYLIVWIALNAVYGYAIIYITRTAQEWYILGLVAVVSTQVIIKLIAAILYALFECCTRSRIWCTGKKKQKRRKKEQKALAKAQLAKEETDKEPKKSDTLKNSEPKNSDKIIDQKDSSGNGNVDEEEE